MWMTLDRRLMLEDNWNDNGYDAFLLALGRPYLEKVLCVEIPQCWGLHTRPLNSFLCRRLWEPS
jgi:hypothetical protein